MSDSSDNELSSQDGSMSFGEELDISNLFQTYFGGPDGVNVVDVMVALKATLDNQNKLLNKIVQKLDCVAKNE